jgi:hypothetical protein
MDHMGFKIVGTLHIIVVGEKDPTVADWAQYVQALRAEEKRGIDVTQMRTLVFSDGGGPNTAMRKTVSDLLHGRTTPLAILTGSAMMRGIITALSWFNPDARAFAPGEAGEALRFLQVPSLKFDSIKSTAQELQKSLGLQQVKALEQARLSPAAAASARP